MREPTKNHRRRAIRLPLSDFQKIQPTNTGPSPARNDRVSALNPNNRPQAAISHRGEAGDSRLRMTYAPKSSNAAREKVFTSGNHAKTKVAEANRTAAESPAIHFRVS